MFRSLRHRDFAFFWTGNFLSNIGTWMQNLALGWLVLEITNSPFLLGLNGFLGSLPLLFFSLPGGAIADRLNRRKLMLGTQTAMMVLALILAILTSVRFIAIGEILVISFCTGLASALNAPAYQAVVLDLVPREDLTNAVALNSAQFNMSRAIGPTLAGLALGSLGAAGCFYLNSVSFLALIIALLAITVPRHLTEEGPSVWAAMVDGLRFVGKNRTIILLLSVPAFLSLFGLPFVVLMPVFARDLLKVGASGLGYLMAGAGLGAVTSALTLAAQSGIRQRGKYIVGSAALFALALILLARTQSFRWAFLLLVVIGATMVGTLTLTNSTLQLTSPRELRGRIMSMYNLAVLGLAPLGCLQAGAIAEALGVRFALTLGGTVCLVYFLILFVFLPRLPRVAVLPTPEPGRLSQNSEGGSENAKRMSMSQEIRADYEQMDLLPQSWEDWVPADHPARFLRAFVDALDLAELGFRQRESEEGRPNYAADLLLKVWLYGYLARLRSTRELERACREHWSLVWLTGRHAPDHNTLWRFWRENRAALRQVFRAGVRVAAEQGLVGMICHAVDGTKIRAVASRRTVEHREELERALGRVEASIAEMEAALEAAEEEKAGEYRLPGRLQAAEQLREALRASLGRMQEAQREHLHAGEPEARLMPCEGRTEPAYNAQAVVDAQAGIIVAATAVNAESDNQLLVPMLEETKANLGAVAEENVADGGYGSAGQLGEAQARGYEVLVAPGAETGGVDRGAYDSSQFEYDAERDEVICPRGERLQFEGRKNRGPHRPAVRCSRCHRYAECPVRALCSRRKEGRRIEWSAEHEAVRRQRSKRRDPAKQALLRQRKVIVEPVFGILKQVEGFRRWTVRGLENVRTQWALVCTAYNLKKLCKAWKQRLAAATRAFRSRPAAARIALGNVLIPRCPFPTLGF